MAGGYKPNLLMDWEKRQKDVVTKRIAAKREREYQELLEKQADEKRAATKIE